MSPSIGTLKRGSFQVQKAAREVKDKIGSRQLLTVFVTTGFVLCGVVEQSAPVALLANNPSPISAQEFADYVENTSYITRYCQPSSQLNLTEEGEKQVHVVLSLPHIEIPMSRTDETESVLREAFMWGTLVSPLAASRVAARAGAETLFGYGVLGTGVVALLVPAAWLSPYHVALRIVQGMCMGATWPAAHMLAVTWFKPRSVSGFVSCYTAVNLGYAVAGLLGTPLVRALGRDSLSYVCCAGAVAWYVLWWRFVEEELSPIRPIRDGATWPAAHMLAVTWFKPRSVSGFVSCYTAVNLGYAVAGLLGTPLVRALGRDSLSYVCCAGAVAWYVLWWRFVEEELSPIRPIRDGATWPAAHMLAVTWFKPRSVSGFVSCYTAVNLGYAVAGLLGTPLVRALGRDSLSYVCCAGAVAWYVLWWRFVEEELSPIRPIRDGATWPAAHMLAVTWFKPRSVSGFVSCYTAVNLGYAVAGLLGTPLVRALGRDSLSYVCCAGAVAWYVLWWRFVEEELSPIRPIRDEHRNLPWRRLLLSGPAWACGVAVVGSQWADATLMLGVTKYLKLVYGFSTAHEHVLVSLPHIGHFLSALLFGYIADHVRASELVSGTTCRKLLVYVSHFLPATLMFVLGYTGCDPTAPAALYVAALLLTAATPAGVYASAADIAPNYAGTVFGLCQTIGAAGLLAANYVVSEGLHGSFAGWWRLVFSAASVVLLTTATGFMALGSGSVQDWNFPEGESPGDAATATASTALVDPEVGTDHHVDPDRAVDCATDTE